MSVGLAVGSPTARRLSVAAALTYACSNVGEMLSALPMLSKPATESSPGSNAATSTGSSMRSRTAFAYSVRFKRRKPGAPGFGAVRAAASSDSSRKPTKAVEALRGRPRLAGRRHQPAAQLADHGFPNRRVRVHAARVEPIEGEIAGALGIVVAALAVAVEHRPLLGDVHARRAVLAIHVRGRHGERCDTADTDTD